MNIYQLHSQPKTLNYYAESHKSVPKLFAPNAADGDFPASLSRKQIESISKDPEIAYKYSVHVLKKRWPEAEPYIMKNPEWAYYYAMNVLKSRWPEAEPTILSDLVVSTFYSKYLLKRRWIEAEDKIRENDEEWSSYAEFFGIPY